MDSNTPDSNPSATFVDGSIKLLNGAWLHCAIRADLGDDKQQPAEAVIDKEAADKAAEREIFINNAFFFLAHRDAIMADSRMFLARVPVSSGGACVWGMCSHVENPTLGAYLEYWLTRTDSSMIDDDGTTWLIYQMGRLPRSASYRYLNKHGATRNVYGGFDLGREYMALRDICRRYAQAAEVCEAFSLREVVERLRSQQSAAGRPAKDWEFESRCYQQYIQKLRNRINYYLRRCTELTAERDHAYLTLHRAELQDFYREYLVHRDARDAIYADVRAHKARLHQQLADGAISHKEFYQQWKPSLDRRQAAKAALQVFVNERLDTLVPEIPYLELSDIERFFHPKPAATPQQPDADQ